MVTASHCIYDYMDRKVFAYNVTVRSAYNTDDVDPTPSGICDTLGESVLYTMNPLHQQ